MADLLRFAPEHFFPRVRDERKRVLVIICYVQVLEVSQEAEDGLTVLLSVDEREGMRHVFRLPDPLQVDRWGSRTSLELRVRGYDMLVESFRTNGRKVRGGQRRGGTWATPRRPQEKDEMAKAIWFEIGVGHFRCRKTAVELSAVFLMAR